MKEQDTPENDVRRYLEEREKSVSYTYCTVFSAPRGSGGMFLLTKINETTEAV
jgi:hypothetical protein